MATDKILELNTWQLLKVVIYLQITFLSPNHLLSHSKDELSIHYIFIHLFGAIVQYVYIGLKIHTREKMTWNMSTMSITKQNIYIYLKIHVHKSYSIMQMSRVKLYLQLLLEIMPRIYGCISYRVLARLVPMIDYCNKQNQWITTRKLIIKL